MVPTLAVLYRFDCTSKNSSVVNTMCIDSYRYTHVITSSKFQLKQTWRLTKAIAEMKHDFEQTMKLEYWGGCTKLALIASCTRDLITQSARASERNSVVMCSNPTQANFLITNYFKPTNYFKESIH